MNPWNTLKRTISKIRRQGIVRTFRASTSHLYNIYFDKKYQLDTVAGKSREKFLKEHNFTTDYGHYQGANTLLVKKLLKRLNLDKNQTFIDLGSGKGRILLLANAYGFSAVKGIELSKELCDISEKNTTAFFAKSKLKSKISILNIDATTYKFDKTDGVLFMYNPFNGTLFEKVVKNLKQSLVKHPRNLTIIYINPTETKMLESHFNFSSIERCTWNEDYNIYTINSV
ncbi:MAG: hypothetical protein AB8B52_03660 [Winogradskyella sp.]|uniref:hypothetical protein n=1 Tax=Winogradskyella sp. TaxID=1883156 RepID=UPI00385FF33C